MRRILLNFRRASCIRLDLHKRADIVEEDWEAQYEGALEEGALEEGALEEGALEEGALEEEGITQDSRITLRYEDVPSEIAFDPEQIPKYDIEITPEQFEEAIFYSSLENARSSIPSKDQAWTKYLQAVNVLTITATSTNTSPKILNQLALHDEMAVREATATNPNTPLNILRQLANDSNSDVQYGVFVNPNTSVEMQVQLARKVDPRQQWHMAKNPNTPPEVLDILIDSADASIRIPALKHPNAPRTESTFKPEEVPLFENPEGGPITFLDLGGPTLTVPYENPVFQGAEEYDITGYDLQEKGTYPEGYVSFDQGPEGSELAPAEEDKHITGDLNDGLPQLEDDSVHGTIFASHSLQYVTNLELLAKDVARVAAPGTEVVVTEGMIADEQGNPDIMDAPSTEYYTTLLEMGFQFVSAIFLFGPPEKGPEEQGESDAVAVVVLRKPEEKLSLNMRKVKK